MLRDRKLINFISRLYYGLMPDFVLNSKRFHEILYRFLIGRWFRLDFKKEYKKYLEKDWEKLYDSLFVNRIREDDLTNNQKNFILRNISGSSVLEVGCGAGTMIERLAKRNEIKRIVGNDISHEAINYLIKKFKDFSKISFIKGNFLNIKFRRKFDTVLCFHVLEHIEDCQKMAKFLIKACRKRLIVIVPQEDYHPYPPNYHLQFFNKRNPVTKLFSKRKNILKIIDGDYILVSDVSLLLKVKTSNYFGIIYA